VVDDGGAGIEATGNHFGLIMQAAQPELANGKSRNQWETPIRPTLYLQIAPLHDLAQFCNGISADVSRGCVIRRKCPLAGGYVDNQFSSRPQVVENGIEKLSFVRKVLEYVKEKDQIERLMKLGQLLTDVVTAESASIAKIPLQRILIQVKTRHFPAIVIFHLPLQKPMTASDFGNLHCVGNHLVVEPP